MRHPSAYELPTHVDRILTVDAPFLAGTSKPRPAAVSRSEYDSRRLLLTRSRRVVVDGEEMYVSVCPAVVRGRYEDVAGAKVYRFRSGVDWESYSEWDPDAADGRGRTAPTVELRLPIDGDGNDADAGARRKVARAD